MTISSMATCGWCGKRRRCEQGSSDGRDPRTPSGWRMRSVPSIYEDREGSGFYKEAADRDLCGTCNGVADKTEKAAEQAAKSAAEEAIRNVWYKAVFEVKAEAIEENERGVDVAYFPDVETLRALGIEVEVSDDPDQPWTETRFGSMKDLVDCLKEEAPKGVLLWEPLHRDRGRVDDRPPGYYAVHAPSPAALAEAAKKLFAWLRTSNGAARFGLPRPLTPEDLEP